jgi:hypothetical protein
MRHAYLFAIVAAAAVGTAGCPAKVATVEVTPKDVVIKNEADTKTLAATAKDKDGKDIQLGDRKFVWSSSDANVVGIGEDGKLKPMGSGKAVVTAKIDEASGTANVKVMLLKGIKLESPAVVVKVGAPHPPLKIAFSNEKGEMLDVKDAKVEWKTADPNVATVGPDGTISGVNAGSTTVTCRVAELSADVAVTVNPADNAAGGDAGPAGTAPPAPGNK